MIFSKVKKIELLRSMPEVLLFHGGASGGAPRSISCRDRGTCANGRVLPDSTCSDRSTCVSDGVHHTTHAGTAAPAPVEKYIAPDPAIKWTGTSRQRRV